ncbi:MAG: acetyl-CoA carboxylase biotin carboxyl carrier protein subunit [Candidatus Hodarchaeales archaeon]
MDFFLEDGEERYKIRVMKNNDDTYTVNIGDEQHIVSGQLAANDTLFLNYNNQTYKCIVAKEGDMRYIYYNGNAFKMKRIEKAALADEDASATDNVIKSPMPGKVLKVLVKEGDTVTKGQQMMILEAMKMENVLEAPFDGKIVAINCHEGDQVMQGVVLIELELTRAE